jgi:septin family protein
LCSVEVTATTVEIEEKGVRLRLTIVDTPGFADAVNNDGSWTPIIRYIDDRYQEFLDAEWRVQRKNIVDNRVHCCLYFVSPNGHGLKPLDVKVLKELDKRVRFLSVSRARVLVAYPDGRA